MHTVCGFLGLCLGKSKGVRGDDKNFRVTGIISFMIMLVGAFVKFTECTIAIYCMHLVYLHICSGFTNGELITPS